MSQDALSEKMRALGFDLSQATIGKIERGERRVTIGEAEGLAAALGKSTSALLAGSKWLDLDYAGQYLRQLRTDVARAVDRFQSAQQMFAMLVDSMERSDGEQPFIDRETLEAELFERPEEILRDLADDHRAEAESRRYRDSLYSGESGSVEESDQLPGLTGDAGGYFARYRELFGDEVASTPDAEVFSRLVRGRSGEAPGTADG